MKSGNKYRLIKLSIVLITFIFSCGNSVDNNKEVNASDTLINEVQKPDSKKETWLIIEGKDIWVRSEPSTGEVIMKLNTGDKCKIIEKGKYEVIRDMEDYWYKISFHDNEGWVFGSQTSVKQQTSKENSVEIPSAQSAKELYEKLKIRAKAESEKMTQDCECMYEISTDFAFENERYAFINYYINQCGATCNQTNYSILITKQNNRWSETAKFEGAFKNLYNSKLKDQVILVTESIHQNHFMEKQTSEEIYFFDERDFKFKKLAISAKSCIILTPDDFGCDFCNNNTSMIESLKFIGDPVVEIEKSSTIIKYDDACKIASEKNNSVIFKWNSDELNFK